MTKNERDEAAMSPRVGLDLNRLVQTAGEIADEHGLDEVTLARLAHRLGIRPPSIYNHVHSLADLRNQLAVYGLKLLAEDMARAAVGRSKDEAVRAVAQAYVAFARSHPGLYEATLRAPDPNHAELREAAEQVVDLVVRVLQAYSLKDEEALHAVRGLRSLLHGFASLEQKGGFGLPLDRDVTLRYIVDTFLAGIRANSSRTAERGKRP